MSCTEVEELTAELALGIVSGAERASALEHLSGCAACRTKVEELAEVADSILLVGPEREPPAGFETRVLDGMGRSPAETAPQHRSRRWLSVAAAVVVVAGLGGAAAGRRSAPKESALTKQYVGALHVMGGSALEAAKLHATSGLDAGEVFAYQGRPSWLFVTVRDTAASGDYAVELVLQGSRPVTVGHLVVSGNQGSLGTTVDVDLTRLQTIHVLDSAGTVRYQASFTSWLPHWSPPK